MTSSSLSSSSNSKQKNDDHIKSNIIIVGGSIAGLMAGVLLKNAGHHVTILEQSTENVRSGTAAGLDLVGVVRKFFEENDRIKDIPIGIEGIGLRQLNGDFSMAAPSPPGYAFRMTTWDTVYYRLRANFDFLKSDYVSNPPISNPNQTSCEYRTGIRCTSVVANSNGLPIVHAINVDTESKVTFKADYVIAAEGANSSLRRSLLPSLKPSKPGYCLWRGTVPRAKLSKETVDAFGLGKSCIMMHHSYVILYPIPGKNGNVDPFAIEYNMAWYQYYNSQKELDDILTDSDGHTHRTSLPKGKMRPEIWQEQLKRAKKVFHSSLYEFCQKVENPFVTVIATISPTQASFLDQRLFLVGDGLFQMQPNSGQGTNLASFTVINLVKAIEEANGKPEHERKRILSIWEKIILDRGGMEVIRSRLYGYNFLRNRPKLYLTLIQLTLYKNILKVKKWWRWLFGLGADKTKDGYIGLPRDD